MRTPETNLPLKAHADINGKLIDLASAVETATPHWIKNGLGASLEHLLAIHKINGIYQSIPERLPAADFCRKSLEALHINYAVTEQELARIPASGPLVVVANHPFGAVEGMILSEILLNARPDSRILGNFLLERIPELKAHIIAVDPFDAKRAAAGNATAIRSVLNWLKHGGALLAFPSGEVSHFSPKSGRIVDPPWHRHVARLATMAKAKVLPVYVHGRNSVFFNLAGCVHPRLRTLLLPREMIKKRSTTIELSFGKPIHWRRLSSFDSDAAATDFLRFHTYLLRHRRFDKAQRLPKRLPRFKPHSRHKPIVAPVPKTCLLSEIEALPEGNRLVHQKAFSVFTTTADRSPAIMREIGRLRELSFRDVGEGTGQSLDTDQFDTYYHQLFLWHWEKEEIVGAYRLGETCKILEERGVRGLYTTSLFDYQPSFLGHLDCALELGRSFIRTEYQRKFGCLSLLWRGIGEFVARNRQYRFLFGPVSISHDYHTISKNLMVAFLQRNMMDDRLRALVKPRCAPKVNHGIVRSSRFDCARHADIEEISLLVSEIESDRKGVPTLIKHYLKLNGRFLAFNVDRDFGNVIDGLVWVDLLKTDPKLLGRFMGDAGVKAFLGHYKTTLGN